MDSAGLDSGKVVGTWSKPRKETERKLCLMSEHFIDWSSGVQGAESCDLLDPSWIAELWSSKFGAGSPATTWNRRHRCHSAPLPPSSSKPPPRPSSSFRLTKLQRKRWRGAQVMKRRSFTRIPSHTERPRLRVQLQEGRRRLAAEPREGETGGGGREEREEG